MSQTERDDITVVREKGKAKMLNPWPQNIYEFHVFDPAEDIRLVRVLQDNLQSEEISIEVTTCPPPDQEYIAISYTWGNSALVNTITYSGLKVLVTQNCYDALRTLRTIRETSLIWIDALCINQNNIPERNLQVGGMSEIFCLAKLVIGHPGREYLPQSVDDTSYHPEEDIL